MDPEQPWGDTALVLTCTLGKQEPHSSPRSVQVRPPGCGWVEMGWERR